MDTIEILLATYNGEKYVAQQIDSIINQSHTDWVLRIADDNSKDNTYKILLEYQNRYPDKIFVEKNVPGYGSAKANFMSLLKKSSGKYVMCCDQDDVWLQDKIALSFAKMRELEQEGKPTLIHTDLKVVDAELSIMSDSFFEFSKLRKEFKLKDNLIQNFVTGCTMMMNRDLVELVVRIDQNDKVLMHDWVLSLLAMTFGTVGFVDKPTMLYRQHGVNSVGAKEYGLGLFIAKLKENKMKEAVKLTCEQAEYILEIYGEEMESQNLYLYREFAQLFDVSKIKRIQKYFQMKFWKNGFARKICQIIFC